MNLNIAQVTGVLNRNSSIRDEHLKRNYGKYSQWKEVLTPAIGDVYNIDYKRPLLDITGGKSLLEYTSNVNEEYGQSIENKYFNGRYKEIYETKPVSNGDAKSWHGKYVDYSKEDGSLLDHTHNDNEQYGQDINHKYFQGRNKDVYETEPLSDGDVKSWHGKYVDYSKEDGSLLDYTHNNNEQYGQDINHKYFQGRDKEIYENKPLSDGDIQPWFGKYVDYITYLDEVLGEDVFSRHVRYINDFLSGNYIENALRQTEVGVVRDINVPIAKQGIITTNPNNLKGIDTPLGTITNYMYSNSLYNGAIFNSDRHSETKYITPSLINQYGNNMANVAELGDMFRVGVGDYRLREDLGADVRIIHNFSDSVFDLNTKWLSQNIEEAERYLDENNQGFRSYKIGRESYVEVVEGENNRFSIGDISEFTTYPSNFTGTDKISSQNTYNAYAEGDNAGVGNIEAPKNEDNVAWENYDSIYQYEDNKSILEKTAKLYQDHKINTLFSRFHTSVDGGITTEKEFIDTAKTKYGNSHGRNLLTRKAQENQTADADDTNGYDNPYCRTWTYHHQYNQVKKLIRPFIEEDNNGTALPISVKDIQKRLGAYRRKDKEGRNVGAEYLGKNTVLGDNGFVNICPSGDQTPGSEKGVRIEKCMFSIENLAWKDVPKFTKENYISKEQTGPNGGRIMWFPPYDLAFNENINAYWTENSFIGRGEKVYTYTNTDRTGTLSFTLLIDHPSIINSYAKLDDGDISSDIDADILRFFAGCEIPEIKEPKKVETGRTIEEDKEIIPSEETGEIKFYIFFPNNFSGLVNKYESKSKKDYETYFEDWWKYLLIGNNCIISPTNEQYGADKEAWIGYEITEGQGISKKYNNATIDNQLKDTWIGVSKCWAKNAGESYCLENKPENKYDGTPLDWSGENELLYQDEATIVNRTTGENCYKYLVDSDLRQLLTYQDSYNDGVGCSHQLNSRFDDKNNYHKGAKYTFAEVIMALIKSGKLKDFQTEEIYDFLSTKGCREKEINGLVELFSTEGLKITKISSEGSADSNDKRNASMLAERRAIVVDKFLRKEITGLEFDTSDIEVIPKQVEDGKKEDASKLDKKLGRYAFITIEYTKPGQTQALSCMSSQATNKSTVEEEQEDEDKFNTWYDYLVEKSTIMAEYDSIFNNEEFEKQYKVFQEELKIWCTKKQIDYKNSANTSDDTWNDNVIDPQITDEYMTDFFIPAIKMSRDGDNSNFIGQLHNYPCFNKAKEENAEKIQQLNEQFTEYCNRLREITGEGGCEDIVFNKNSENGEIGEINAKIKICKEKISGYTYGNSQYAESGITNYNAEIEGYKTQINTLQEEINEIEYELSHWTTGDKREKERQLKEKKKQIEQLNTNISKDEAKKSKLESEVVLETDKKSKLEEQKKLLKSEFDSIKEKLSVNRQEVTDAYHLEEGYLDLTKTEIYFEKLFENGITLDEYKSYDDNNYFNFNSLVIDFDKTLPYSSITHSVDIDSASGSVKYNGLLLDYLIINRLDTDIEKGYEYACDYIGANYADLYALREMLYLEYLIKGYDSSGSTSGWSLNDTTKINLTRDVGKVKYINYTPLQDAIDEIKRASDSEVVNRFKKYKDNILKYCEVSTAELIEEIKEEAENAYNAAKKAAEDAARDKNSQKMKRKYQAECDTLANLSEEMQNKKDQYMYSVFNGGGSTRYENEAEYFKKLEVENPLIFKSIKEKFKYFNPAFHSMSPEGFNARLNFLHQCTRQGHTYEPSQERGITTASNLAFGRMPICVLKIGDFINTKIIINNVQINYDNNGSIQWDLNPEGAGVQPMYAKVNLGITIIGGQSLNGPINRLQNAVSFNYYANTGVYDDRADKYIADDTGKITGFDKIFTIKPDSSGTEGSLYRDPKGNNNNFDNVGAIQSNREAYLTAKENYDGYQLSRGNNQC